MEMSSRNVIKAVPFKGRMETFVIEATHELPSAARSFPVMRFFRMWPLSEAQYGRADRTAYGLEARRDRSPIAGNFQSNPRTRQSSGRWADWRSFVTLGKTARRTTTKHGNGTMSASNIFMGGQQ